MFRPRTALLRGLLDGAMAPGALAATPALFVPVFNVVASPLPGFEIQ
ncbi:hypothetical protein WME75_18375 [Sorangium sp. So ce1014]